MGSSEITPPEGLAGRFDPGPPPRLLASRCRSCGQVAFPAGPHCPRCWAGTERLTLPAEGTLYTFTTIHDGGGPPRVLGYADFGPVRVLAPLAGAPPRIGARVTVTVTTLGPPGARYPGYAFAVSRTRPAGYAPDPAGGGP